MAGQPVAGELYESITGQLFELGRQLRQKSGYPYDPHQLKAALQEAIEGRFKIFEFESYTPDVPNMHMLYKIEEDLRGTGRFDRTYSLESELVKGWIARPEIYPEEFKGKRVFLWQSAKYDLSDSRNIQYLYWASNKVCVAYEWIGSEWIIGDVVLLKMI